MASEDGRKQAKVKRNKPVTNGNLGTDGSGGQIPKGGPDETISYLIRGFEQLISEHNEMGFQLSKVGAYTQGKAREWTQELDRIKALHNLK